MNRLKADQKTKPKVRINSIKCLMDLYFHVMTSSPLSYFSKDLNKVADSTSVYTESDKECVRFIPNVVFHLYRLIQKTPAYQDARLTIERYLQLNFIPYKIEVKKRVRLMVDLFRSLDDIGVIMFADVIHRSSQLRRAMIGILSQVGQSANAAKTDYTAQLKERIRRIVQIFPDSTALEKVLMNFVNQMAEDEETFNLVKQLMADNYTSVENQNAAIALKRIMEKKITAKNQVVNFRHFIDRVSPLAFDVPAAKELVHVVSETVTAKFQMKKWADNCIDRDLGLLKIFTENFTHLFTDDQIVEEVRASMLNTEEPRAVEAGLDALSKIFNNSAFRHKVDSEATRREKWYLTMSKDLKDLVVRSDPLYRRSCKLATRLVACLLGKEKSVKFFDEILETLQNRLHLDSEGAANAYQALGEIFRTDVAHFLPQMLDEIESDRIGPSLLSSAEHSENDPVEFNELLHMEKQPWPQLTMTKVYAAKFSTKVITAHSLCPPAEKKRLERASQKFIDVLSEILENKGDLRGRQCELEKARLRAAASSCLLKIAQIAVYRPKFDTTLFKNLSYQITDDAYCVRLHYANHVKKGLGRKLPIEFAACYGLINLGLLEEDGDNKIDGFKAICINQAQQAFSERNEERADLLKLEGPARAMFCSESVIAYAVWLLANYDKLETIEENAQKNDSEDVLEEKVKNVNLLAELQESLWLVIDTLKNARCNMQKVYKVLEKLKTCGDKAKKTDRSLRSADLREQNKKLWAICDLAINMLLYRAKIQNEDQDIKETGYNLQFFYSCEQSNQADPSNVYAPDVLLNDEKHRNGKLPKHGRIFHVSDLTAGFTPPPHNDDSGGSTTLKNTSKRGANTSGTRKRGAKKRKSGGNEESDVEEVVIEEEDEDEVKTKKISPRITRKPRSKREVPDEDVEEILPVSKRRAPPPPQPTPSTSSSTNSSKANGTKNGVSPKKRNSRGRRREIEIEDDEGEGEDDEEGNVSLDNLIISPILPETSGRTRRSARTATLTSSTPLVAPKPKQSKRKRQEEEEEVVIEETEEEEEEEAPKAVQVSPKKRSSGGRRRPTPSPTKKKTSSGSPQKKKSAKNEYGLPLDEEEEEEQQKQPTKSATPALRTRTSARLSRK
uniref:Uncharacterized protein n=1 Tax=Caenorhabditis japonica TaxID=281687 RepID=A0A8R1I5A3_CAEJA